MGLLLRVKLMKLFSRNNRQNAHLSTRTIPLVIFTQSPWRPKWKTVFCLKLIGDSIIKNIIPQKLSRKRVHKFTYPGLHTRNIDQNLAPSHVILHYKTNNKGPFNIYGGGGKASKISDKIFKISDKPPYLHSKRLFLALF